MELSIAALAVALGSIAVSIWQFFTRTRPFVGVSGCQYVGDHYALVLKNWGDVAAEDLTIEFALISIRIGESEAMTDSETGNPIGSKQRMDILLPGQTMTVDLSSPVRTKTFETKLLVSIDYSSPVSLKLGKLKLGRYRFKQTGWTLRSGEWRAHAQVEPRFGGLPESDKSSTQ